MAGRTPPEAVAAFVEPLQQAISCVSPAVLQVAGGYRPAAHPHALVLADGEPQPLRAEAELALRVAQQYRIVEDTESRGPWKVQTAAYSYKGGKVSVSPPTRMLGDSKTAQAKAITALVAGARAKGLGESTVRSEFVHDELKRKQCWDQNNFNKHLRALQGYNVGSDRSEIITTSKWVGEFSDAVAQALGKAADE